VTYITPVFASAKYFPEHFGRGVRSEYDPKSGWWNEAVVQQLTTINYASAIEDVKAVRDPMQESLYKQTAAAQELAASLIEVGRADLGVQYLTTFMNNTANTWFDTYSELGDFLTAKYMLGNVSMKVPSRPDWWTNIILENMGDKLRPVE
jgi:dipeptidase